jgi:glycosyltransferase involved in cell wall biosynthesis
MSPVRIAMVSSRYPPQLGGVETHVYEVARRLAARGLDLTVLTTDLTGELPAVEHDGLMTVRRYVARPRRADLYISPALVRQIRDGGYDLVHVQGVNNFLPPLSLAAAQRSGVPTVATFHTGGHSSRLRTMVRGMQWRALRPVLRRAEGLVAVCHYEVEVFARRLGVQPEMIRLIRNGAEPLPVGDSPPEVSGAPLVCSVARLERYKGHDRLIAAMPALLERAPSAHLAVIGRGRYERQLHRLVGRLGVEDAVTFTSFDSTRREALGALLRSSDVVALMSDYEANPVAVMEALALGRKVVVADTSGLSELASEGLATAVPANVSPLVLAGVLAEVAAQPDPVAPNLPTWDGCADQLLGLYEEILSPPPGV